MKKRTLPIFLLVLIFVMSVSVFTACNPDNENSSGGGLPDGVTVEAGDNIFTEDATLEQLSVALENADSLTIERGYGGTMWENGVSYDAEIVMLSCIDRIDKILWRRNSEYSSDVASSAFVYESYCFPDNNMNYFVSFANYRDIEQEDGSYITEFNNDGQMTFDTAEKSDTPFEEYEYVSNDEWQTIISMLVMKDGKLALTDDEDAYVGSEVMNRKLDLNGTTMTISYTVNDYDEEGNVNGNYYYYFTIKGVNGTKINISEEIKSYCKQA